MESLKRILLSVYLWSAVSVVTVLASTLIVLVWPLALVDPSRRVAHSLGTLWASLLLRLNPLWRFQSLGRERIKKNQAYVLISNHASLSDIVCLFTLRHPYRWLAKRSLFYIPFLGWAIKAMGSIPLERGRHGSIRDSYAKSLEWLKQGVSVLIFPEGTRSRTGEMGKFKSGAFKLAIESGCPIVPIVLAGTQQIIAKGKSSFGRPGRAVMSVLDPIETKGLDPDGDKALRNRVENLMREELKILKGTVP